MSLARDIEYSEGTIYNEDGRSTIPKKIREQLGLEKGDNYVFVIEGDEIQVMSKGEFAEKAVEAGIEW